MIKLKPYLVVLIAKPSARLPESVGRIELNFNDPDSPKKLIIEKIEEESAGTLVQTGVSFRVFLDSESLTEAINSTKNFADGIVSFITLLTGKGMESPLEQISYELTPNAQKREFRQIFYDVPMKKPSRRQVDPTNLSSISLIKPLRLNPRIRNTLYEQFGGIV